jgi:hypothetical protein
MTEIRDRVRRVRLVRRKREGVWSISQSPSEIHQDLTCLGYFFVEPV